MTQIIEKDVPFHDSVLWKWQEAAYKEFGPNAWEEKGVPFYLTSNPFVAHHYAEWVEALLRDLLPESIDPGHPIYLFDLGAGTGRFAYLFLKNFLPRLNKPLLRDLSITYVMTDIAEKNLTFWESHSHLRPFFSSGVLDCALFHHETTASLSLRRKKIILEKGAFRNPPILLANYFFDTIPQSLAKADSEHVYEGRVTLTKERGNNAFDPDFLHDLTVAYSYEPIAENRLSPIENHLAKRYRATAKPYLIPRGAFAVFERFLEWTEGNFALFAMDQGWAHPIEWHQEPAIDRHGTFSLTVNYDALRIFVKERGGDSLAVSSGDGTFVQGAFLFPKNAWMNMNYVWENTAAYFSIWDYWDLIEKLPKDLSLDAIYHLLQIGRGDPQNAFLYLTTIHRELAKLPQEQRRKWVPMLRAIRENLYPLSAKQGEISALFHKMSMIADK